MAVNKKQWYLFANWKMYLDYGESVALAHALTKAALSSNEGFAMAVFPSALAFSSVQSIFQSADIAVGAQNVYWVDTGGYTGEVSAAMYRAVGATYALIGHSERRHLFRETNHEVRQKMEAALAAGLTPVLCIGETLEEKNADKTREVIEVQLRSAYDNLLWPPNRPLLIAYEPVWAISKGISSAAAGLPCSPADAEAIHMVIAEFMKELVPATSARILFGGSVRVTTVADYLAQVHIDGVLVGAASTNLDSWLAITRAAQASS